MTLVGRWALRLGYGVAIWLAFWGLLAAAGSDVNALLLGLAILTATVLVCVSTDLAPTATAADWQATYIAPARVATNDPRFSRLSRMLTEASNRITVADEVQRSLIAIVDYRLRHDHAVDRATQPDEARALLGPDLFNYLSRPARQRGADAKHLARLLTRIEAL
jgi:hypothetical protein